MRCSLAHWRAGSRKRLPSCRGSATLRAACTSRWESAQRWRVGTAKASKANPNEKPLCTVSFTHRHFLEKAGRKEKLIGNHLVQEGDSYESKTDHKLVSGN